jgi:hypothetical protein
VATKLWVLLSDWEASRFSRRTWTLESINWQYHTVLLPLKVECIWAAGKERKRYEFQNISRRVPRFYLFIYIFIYSGNL